MLLVLLTFDEQVPCIENQHCLTMPMMLGQKQVHACSHPIQALTLPVHKLQLVQVANSHMLH